jgi:hypothetical protein
MHASFFASNWKKKREIASNCVQNAGLYGSNWGWEASKANCINGVYGAGDGNRITSQISKPHPQQGVTNRSESQLFPNVAKIQLPGHRACKLGSPITPRSMLAHVPNETCEVLEASAQVKFSLVPVSEKLPLTSQTSIPDLSFIDTLTFVDTEVSSALFTSVVQNLQFQIGLSKHHRNK